MSVASLQAPGSGANARSRFIDPQALMTIRNLELRARMVVEGFWHGLHRSPFHGFSVEFTEYRPYASGDDPRYLDWRLYARTDRFYIKKFEDETNLRCILSVDHSRSMSFGSIGFSKAEYARTLAATLAYFLYQQGDAIGLITFDEQLRDYLPPRHRLGQLRHVILKLDTEPAGSSTNLQVPIRWMLQNVRRRSLFILVSDFLAPLDNLATVFRSLSVCGHDVVLFHLLDPEESEFNGAEPVLFRDLETDQELYIDPPVAREAYLGRLEAHRETLHKLCMTHGLAYQAVVTSRPLESVLFDFLRLQMHRSKSRRLRAARR